MRCVYIHLYSFIVIIMFIICFFQFDSISFIFFLIFIRKKSLFTLIHFVFVAMNFKFWVECGKMCVNCVWLRNILIAYKIDKSSLDRDPRIDEQLNIYQQLCCTNVSTISRLSSAPTKKKRRGTPSAVSRKTAIITIFAIIMIFVV